MSNNPHPQDDGSQLYDNFEISPPSIVIRKADTDQSLNKNYAQSRITRYQQLLY